MSERKFVPSVVSADEGRRLLEGRGAPRKSPVVKTEPEHEMQCDVFNWFRWKYPQYNKSFFAIPNGGKLPYKTVVKRGRKIHVSPERDKLLKEGMLPGASDTFLAVPRGGWHGLFIENKILPNQPSTEQVEFLDQAHNQGYCTAVAYSYEQNQLIIDTYLALPEFVAVGQDFEKACPKKPNSSPAPRQRCKP